MNSRPLLAGAMALLALTGCKKDPSQGPVASEQPVKITQASPPAGGTWVDVVNETGAGYMMGNPNAKVKLVEIASLGCPVCKKFEQDGVPHVMDLVKGGQLSWEMRPYLIHGPVDMAANLIARCNDVKTFFPLAKAFYDDQDKFMSKIEATPQDKLAQMQNLPPEQLFVAMASLVGMQDWAAARGIPVAKSNQCLADRKMIDREVQLTSDVSTQYPDFTGTPSFIINGTMVKDAHNWQLLEPPLKAALK